MALRALALRGGTARLRGSPLAWGKGPLEGRTAGARAAPSWRLAHCHRLAQGKLLHTSLGWAGRAIEQLGLDHAPGLSRRSAASRPTAVVPRGRGLWGSGAASSAPGPSKARLDVIGLLRLVAARRLTWPPGWCRAVVVGGIVAFSEWGPSWRAAILPGGRDLTPVPAAWARRGAPAAAIGSRAIGGAPSLPVLLLAAGGRRDSGVRWGDRRDGEGSAGLCSTLQ
jgi:hypothetical protein